MYKAITDHQLWEAYRKSLLRPARRPEPGEASRAGVRAKSASPSAVTGPPPTLRARRGRITRTDDLAVVIGERT